MKKVKFTYGHVEIMKAISKHFGYGGSATFLRYNEKNDVIDVKVKGTLVCVDKALVCQIFGGHGGFYKGGEYVSPCVKWHNKGKNVSVDVWKTLLTIEELRDTMRKHNVGFGDKGNPKILRGVVVYSPSASGWKRYLWDCDFKDRAYYVHSNAETYLEIDPSAGLCRHPHCVLTSLRGGRANGGETLLRPDYSWKVDYCYIDGIEKKD